MMKKIVFMLAIVFTMSSFTTEKENSTMFFQDCWEEAWAYGTERGGGDAYNEWYYTNSYANRWCGQMENT